MRKLCVCFIMLAALVAVSSAPASCLEAYEDAISSASDEIERLLPESAREYMRRKNIEGASSIESVVEGILNDLTELIKTPASVLSSLIPIIVLGALLGAFTERKLEPASNAVLLAVSLTVSAAVLASVSAFIRESNETLAAAGVFCTGYISVFAGVSVASGSVSSATLFAAAMAAVSEAFSLLATRVISPLNGVLLGISAVCAIDENGLSRIAPAIKKIIAWILGAATAFAVGLVNLRQAAAAGADTLALRTGRYIIGSAVPLVGSSVAEALGAVTAGLKLARNGVGILGIAAAIAIFLPTLLCGLLTALSMEICAAVSDTAGLPPVALTLRSIKSCIEINVAVIASFFVIMAFSIGAMASSM